MTTGTFESVFLDDLHSPRYGGPEKTSKNSEKPCFLGGGTFWNVRGPIGDPPVLGGFSRFSPFFPPGAVFQHFFGVCFRSLSESKSFIEGPQKGPQKPHFLPYFSAKALPNSVKNRPRAEFSEKSLRNVDVDYNDHSGPWFGGEI